MNPLTKTLQEYFVNFISMPDTEVFVKHVLEEICSSRTNSATSSEEVKTKTTHRRKFSQEKGLNISDVFDSALSPVRGPLSPSVNRGRTLSTQSPPRTPSAGHSPRSNSEADSIFDKTIRPFYFPNGIALAPQLRQRYSTVISKFFSEGKGALGPEQFVNITTHICGLSSFCSLMLFQKIDKKGVNLVQESQFRSYWGTYLEGFDVPTRLYNILLPANRTFLVRDDFRLLIREVVERHRGLAFLDETPEFQMRYVQTVIARIFYVVNKSGNERITLSELKKSNFCTVLNQLDDEEDINKINDYFSYEHFYVIYCKFWELDTDHDFQLSFGDLARYDNYALTRIVLERIMAGVPRRLISRRAGRMSYEDFIIFFISEIDKTSDTSVDYWFKCIDLDGDGVITVYELEPFLDEQIRRINTLSHEPIHVQDLMCQMSDMVNPQRKGYWSRNDLKKCGMAPTFFNMLFNMNRYALSEVKDPFIAQQIHDTPELSDWDRYAISEYYKLSEAEEEAQDVIGDDTRDYDDDEVDEENDYDDYDEEQDYFAGDDHDSNSFSDSETAEPVPLSEIANRKNSKS